MVTRLFDGQTAMGYNAAKYSIKKEVEKMNPYLKLLVASIGTALLFFSGVAYVSLAQGDAGTAGTLIPTIILAITGNMLLRYGDTT